MKAYGLRPKFNYNGYQDRRPHPHRKYVNWWEVELNTVKSKKTERIAGKQLAKREFDQMINDYNYYIWSDDVKENYLCIYCKALDKLCGDCEYWNDKMNEAIKTHEL